MDRRWNGNNLYKTPPNPVSLKLNPLLYKNPWQQTQLNRNDLNYNRRYSQPYRQLPSQSSSTLLSPSKPFDFSSISNKIQNFFRKTRSVNENEHATNTAANEYTENDEDWEHYYAHRDRRDLYDRIVNASPM